MGERLVGKMARGVCRPLAGAIAALLCGAGPVLAQSLTQGGEKQVREEASGLVIVDSRAAEGTIVRIDP